MLGQAVRKALGDKRGIRRYGESHLPMDEALTRAAVDISGRPYLVWRSTFTRAKIGEIDTELFHEFFQALRPECRHHPACREPLRRATTTTSPRPASRPGPRAARRRSRSIPRRPDAIPSTKGSAEPARRLSMQIYHRPRPPDGEPDLDARGASSSSRTASPGRPLFVPIALAPLHRAVAGARAVTSSSSWSSLGGATGSAVTTAISIGLLGAAALRASRRTASARCSLEPRLARARRRLRPRPRRRPSAASSTDGAGVAPVGFDAARRPSRAACMPRPRSDAGRPDPRPLPGAGARR